MADPLNKALMELLAEERLAILAGEFQRLPTLAGRKVALFAKFEATPATVQTLRRIGAQVSRNQKLLGAALRGLREVSDRLGVVRDLRNGFSTYDSQGQKSTVAAARPGFEHKV
jgi:flagellar biosynthesis/type III secretory pathway chaperone